MASRPRCEETEAPRKSRRSRRGGVALTDFSAGSHHITPVCQAISKPDSKLARLRQADEGRVSPTAEGRKREPSPPTASCYFLRSSQTRTCTRVTAAGPGVRLATSPAKGKALRRRCRQDALQGDRDGSNGSDARTTQAPKTRQRLKRCEVGKFSTVQEAQRVGTWNVQTLRGVGKTE